MSQSVVKHRNRAARDVQHRLKSTTRFRISTIGTRLLVGFVSVVLLTAAIGGGGAAVTGLQSGNRQVQSRLEMAMAFKKTQLRSWAAQVTTAMNEIMTSNDVEPYLPYLFQDTLQNATGGDTYSTFHQAVSVFLSRHIKEKQLFQDILMLNVEGRVVLSLGELRWQDCSDQAFFQQGLQKSGIHLPVALPLTPGLSVVVSQPVLDAGDRVIGVVAGQIDISALNEIMAERAGLGDTGETYLVGMGSALATESRFAGYQVGQATINTQGAALALERRAGGFGFYQGYRGRTVAGAFSYVPELNAALLVEQERAEALRDSNRAILINGGVALLGVCLAVVAAIFLMRSIAVPVAGLAKTVRQITEGDTTAVARVERNDEIGDLAQNFNQMTAQLRDSINTLEQRVAERTQALARRSAYLEASSAVGQAAASILDVEQLLRQVVELIRQRFELYYAGLFIVDAAREWAILRAGTGEAGQAMLARGHRIQVGEGMIGWTIAHTEARIAQRAEDDIARLSTPELPNTLSEAALPLRARSRVIGALSVQSDRSDAFDQDVLVVLQTMADQVALAIDNAQLLSESTAAAEAAQQAFGTMTAQTWAELLRGRFDWGYRYVNHEVTAVEGGWQPEMLQAMRTGERVFSEAQGRSAVLSIPLRVRDQVVGVLRFHKRSGEAEWAREEVELLGAVVGQLEQALEVAQLYENTQRQAAREQVIGEMSVRFTQSLDLETLLRTAVRELGQLPNVAEASVHIGPW